MKKEAAGYPVLIGFPVAHRTPGGRIDGWSATAWCPHCRVWHWHGWGEGHRVAHCTNRDGPFAESGYFIRSLTKTKARELIKQLQEYLAAEAAKAGLEKPE